MQASNRARLLHLPLVAKALCSVLDLGLPNKSRHWAYSSVEQQQFALLGPS
jgi:hypothetical protein